MQGRINAAVKMLSNSNITNYLLISSRNVKNLCLADDITGAGKLVNSKKS